MRTAKIFQNGQSQALRLPKEFRFDGDEVYIKKMGRMTLLFPKDDPWSLMVGSLEQFSEDFMFDRNQPDQQKREDFF